MEKILFISRTNDINIGSYRIWINDLNIYFRECNIPSQIISGSFSNLSISEYDIIICGKSDLEMAVALKKGYPYKKVGIINLNSNIRELPIDFIIVGSLEEMASLSHYKHVFLYPLIERIFQQETDYKVHNDSTLPLRIGFHGHYTHLSKFNPFIKSALEEVDKIYNCELLIITTNALFNWNIGRPNIKNIIIKQWNIDTIKNDLLSCDIGIVPNVSYLNLQALKLGDSVELGLYNTDYVLRFKNKSNAGRCFVFHQLEYLLLLI